MTHLTAVVPVPHEVVVFLTTISKSQFLGSKVHDKYQKVDIVVPATCGAIELRSRELAFRWKGGQDLEGVGVERAVKGSQAKGRGWRRREREEIIISVPFPPLSIPQQ
jgi:hypothetical protein